MKTPFKTLASMAVLSTMLVSCGKDNKINGSNSSDSGTVSAASSSLAQVNTDLQNLINQTPVGELYGNSARRVLVKLAAGKGTIISDLSGESLSSTNGVSVGATAGGDIAIRKAEGEYYLSINVPAGLNIKQVQAVKFVENSEPVNCKYRQIATLHIQVQGDNGYAFSQFTTLPIVSQQVQFMASTYQISSSNASAMKSAFSNICTLN